MFIVFCRFIVDLFTKEGKGKHDRPISRTDVVDGGILCYNDLLKVTQASLDLFNYGTIFLKDKGVTLVDTKYEFGLDKYGNLILMDEIHTPDSSRFWRGGHPEMPLDKEIFRESPVMDNVMEFEIGEAYALIYELTIGKKFEPSKENYVERMEKNLRKEGYLK